MKFISPIKRYALYAVLFTLPMFIRLNNIFLVIFFALFILEGGFKMKLDNLKRNYRLMVPLVLIFLLALLAALNLPESVGSVFKNLEKYWGLLIIPITIISCPEEYNKEWRNLFMALLWGCIATLAICYGNAIYEMFVGNEPLHYFWRFRHLNHQFTAIADTHPAYLGLFIVVSITYLFMESSYKKWAKIIICFILLLGLIQLASRTAIICTLLMGVILLWSRIKTNWKEIAIGFGVFALIGLLFINTASSFMKERLISFQNIENDQRLSRYKVSYDIFTEYPVFGVGFANKETVRKEKYLENNFITAAEERYNAHNQLLEYLSVNGIIGGIIFLGVFGYLLFMAWRKRQFFFFWALVLFFIANLTESMLVVIKGIEFFAITVSLLIILNKKEKSFS
ncbi:O-antigen ligase family protein [Aequorivita soesokkakensis]|nr:O-antigen ligase family protein [Aequorivita soesokkakensis]